MNMLDIDWPFMRATFLVGLAIASVAFFLPIGAWIDDRWGDQFYGYLARMLKRYDERKARKTR